MSAENAASPSTPTTPAPSVPAAASPTLASTSLQAGDACTTADGRSGYMVAVGDKLECVASDPQ